jgi:hypothetical protein
LKNFHYIRRFIMNSLIKNRFRILALLILILVLGAATYGFAAGNTVASGVAGEGSGGISGYAVTGVHYTLDSTTPTLFTSVEIDLGAAAATNNVYAGVSLSGGTPASWVTCTYSGSGTVWNCPLSGAVDTAEELHVAAAQ